jgi:hypothetical protein
VLCEKFARTWLSVFSNLLHYNLFISAWSQIVSTPISFLSLLYGSIHVYFYLRLGWESDPDPTLKKIICVMPFIFILITGPLLSLILIATYFHGYVFIFVLIILVSKALLMRIWLFKCVDKKEIIKFLYGEDVEKGMREWNLTFLISIFTSWVSPCAIFDGEGTSGFLLVLSFITSAIHLLGNCFLFGFINLQGIVSSSSPPIFHCFVNERSIDNTTEYQLQTANDSLIQICNDCSSSIRLCEDNENPSYVFNTVVGPLAATLLVCSFASAFALCELGDNEVLYIWSNIFLCKHPINGRTSESGTEEHANTTTKRVWEEQPIFKCIKKTKLGMVCLLHFLGMNCEIFDASGNSALKILLQRIEDGEVDFEHSMHLLNGI